MHTLTHTLAACAELIRAYQGEIDQLAQRAKRGEDAFYALYQKLAPAVDPVRPSALTYVHADSFNRAPPQVDALDRAVSRIDEVVKLRKEAREHERVARELAEYKAGEEQASNLPRRHDKSAD